MGDQRHIPAAFPPGNDLAPIVLEAGWAPGPVWTGAENFAPTDIRSPYRPARSESPYRGRHPGPPWMTFHMKNALLALRFYTARGVTLAAAHYLVWAEGDLASLSLTPVNKLITITADRFNIEIAMQLGTSCSTGFAACRLRTLYVLQIEMLYVWLMGMTDNCDKIWFSQNDKINYSSTYLGLASEIHTRVTLI